MSKVSEQEEAIYHMYTNQNVISKLDACAELRWLSEIRTVTVMFLEVEILGVAEFTAELGIFAAKIAVLLYLWNSALKMIILIIMI